MQETDAVVFVRNVLACNGQQFTEAEVVKQAEDMWQEADKDKSVPSASVSSCSMPGPTKTPLPSSAKRI